MQSANTFLKWDSHLECSGPLELDDYTIGESLIKTKGPIGTVDSKLIPDIWKATSNNGRISASDLALIRIGLGIP